MSTRRPLSRRSRSGFASRPWRIARGIAEYVDRRIGWDKLAVFPGLAILFGLRVGLRQENLHDTTHLPSVNLADPGPQSDKHKVNRSADGSYNDLDEPRTGMAGTRFNRNIPLENIASATPEDVLSRPNPREVSRALLTRHEMIPAESVNSLVSAWLQFMIRDWFSHGTSPADRPWEVPLMDDDPWPEHPMRIMRTPDDPTRDPKAGAEMPDTHVNVSSHWWDASQIYGSNEAEQRQLRAGGLGRLRLWDGDRTPFPDPSRDPSRVPGFWLGLVIMQQLFAREHNAICDHLHAAYPSWDDEELFQRARLVNSALIAKIHTVEWTPAVISHPTTVKALRTNWWGLAGERVHDILGRISDSELVSGIPGAKTDHYGAPFALTEEFVAIYRMHPLIRDHWHLRSAIDNETLRHCTLREISGPEALKVFANTNMADLLYSFGTLHPGLVTLHNFPRFLQEFQRPDGHLQDLAATDILRSRELGVPRYNEFRRLLRMKPAASFEDLTDNPTWAEEIKRLYANDIEKVDATVGMYAEKLPAGFTFSNTAFRIFILMASVRMSSDRFFTEYYTPDVYSKAGMAWIDDNSMATVILRHHPELRPALAGLTNAFVPWRDAQAGTGVPDS